MVDTALKLNKTVRAQWLDICCAWDKPGCASYAALWSGNDKANLLLQMKDNPTGARPSRERVINAINEVAQAYNDWRMTYKNDTDIIQLTALVDSFILKAFNGPVNPVIRRVMGAVEYLRKPKCKVQVTPDKVKPSLKHAIFFMSWCDHEGIDLHDVDCERIGADYDTVASGRKPSNLSGRARKKEINASMRDLGLSFVSENAVYSGAEKWYTARVIRGSITEAASDYSIANPSTFEVEIKDYDNIAGLR